MTPNLDVHKQNNPIQVAKSYARIGVAYHRQGRLNEAENAFRYAFTKYECPEIGYNLATILDESEKFEDAVFYFKKSIELKPDFIPAYNNLGVSLSRLGKKRSARLAFKKVLQLTRDEPSQSFHRSAALLNLGLNRKAVKCFIQAVQYCPEQAGTFTDLYSALSQETDVELRLSQRTVSNFPLPENSTRNQSFFKWRLFDLEFLNDAVENYLAFFKKPKHIYVGAGLLTVGALPVLAIIPQTGLYQRFVETIQGQGYQAPTPPPPPPQSYTPYAEAPQLTAIAPVDSEPIRAQSSQSDKDSRDADTATQGQAPERGPRMALADGLQPSIERAQANMNMAKDLIDDISSDVANHNIRFGNVGLDLSVFSTLEYNDNITSSSSSQKADFISSVGINFGTTWDISKILSLQFDSGITFSKYWRHDELDSTNNFAGLSSGFGKGAGTELAVNFKLDEFKFRIYDNIAYSISAVDARVPLTDSNGEKTTFTTVDSFGRFVNRGGIRASWDAKQTKTSFGAERQDTIPVDKQFKFANSTQYNFPLGISYDLAKNKTAGISASYSFREYNGSSNGFSNNDGGIYSVQPFFAWQPVETVKINTFAGYSQMMSNDNGSIPAGLPRDTSNEGTGTGGLGITHAMNRVYQHSLDFTRTLDFGQTTNSITSNNASYSFTWQFLTDTALKGMVGYGQGEESGERGESYERYSGSLSLGYKLTKNTSLDLTYGHTEKTSDQSNRDYTQNRVVFGVNYDF